MRTLARVPTGWWFAIAFVLFCCAYEYGRITHLRPLPHHLGRQSDCLGMTWNYAFSDADLFEPRMMNLHADDNTTGRTAAEFPLIYWLMGMLWRAIGQNEFAYRLFGAILHFAGSYALFRTATDILRSPFWGGWVALLFFTSPATAYFAVSFLPEVPAFDLILIGAWCFARHVQGGARGSLLLAFACFALATLLKVSAGMLPLALMCVWAGERWMGARMPKGWRVFPRSMLTLACFIGAIALVITWYRYSAWYNSIHGNPFTTTGLSPWWEMNASAHAEALHFAGTVLVHQLFGWPIWAVFIAALGVTMHGLRRLPRQAVLLTIALLIALPLYLVGWAMALFNHDYYFIHPQVVLITLLISALWLLGRSKAALLKNLVARSAAVALLFYGLAYCTSGLRMRVHGDSPIGDELFVWLHPAEEVAHWGNDRYWNYSGALAIEPYARSLGITRESKVLVVPDGTWQAGLYLIGQTGWNDYTVHLSDSIQVDHYLRYHGADYLYVLNNEWRQRPYMRSFLRYPMGEKEGLWIYDLRPLR